MSGPPARSGNRPGIALASALNTMEAREFGNTGLFVSALGFGAGQVGDAAIEEAEAGALLNAALDLGITLVDTARGYGLSEERIGRHLAHRREEFVLSTKVGYDVPGFENWTGPCITAGVDAALDRLRTDVIDIVHLHSCPLDVLERGDVVEALERAVEAGKVRVAAYSGDNEPLEWAVASGRFGSVQTSVNIFDQRVIDRGLAAARERGLGLIAKRPVGNAPWRFEKRPVGDYCEEYWVRMKAMGIEAYGGDWQELALRFTAWLPGVASCIVGTRNLDHLRLNAELVARGPLLGDEVDGIRAAFREHDDGWTGQI
jgi:aryl-alcohol dehydrogenase-like predicted oxidoreductase